MSDNTDLRFPCPLCGEDAKLPPHSRMAKCLSGDCGATFPMTKAREKAAREAAKEAPPPKYEEPQVQSPSIHAPTIKRGGRKKGLLVGIEYRGTANRLKGCHNDVNYMEYMLVNRFHWNKGCIVKLTEEMPNNRWPNKATIVECMKWLVADCQAGDSLFFFFAGRGMQTPSSDEKDGKNEALCPLDTRSAGPIIDDDINRLMVNVLPKGVKLTCVFDCCHSGSIMDLPYSMEVMDIKFIATNKWDNMFGSQLRTQGGTLVDTSDVLEKAVDGIMIYYGAGYLDACRKFNPLFIKRYKELVKAGKKMWVVYVSDDSTESRFDDTVKDMPWLSVPFKNKKQIVALRDRFKVSKYPTVMVLGQGGNVFTNQGVGLVLSGMAIDLTREPPKDLGQWQMEAELTKVYKGTRGGHVFCISGCGDQEHRNALAEAASQKLNNVNCGPLTYAFTQVVEEATREHKTYSYIEFCKRLQRHLSHGIHKRDTKTKEERNNPIQSFLGATPKTKVSNNPYGGLNAQGESSGIGDVHDVRPGMAENPMISSNVMFDLKDKFAI